jgi:GNAT superfamily N-acetyltransferase
MGAEESRPQAVDEPPTVVVARPEDEQEVVADQTAAVADDPVIGWVFPDPRTRTRYARHFFAMHARRLLPGGLAWRSDGGAALWAGPGRWRESPWASARLALACLPAVGRRAPRVSRSLLALEARHPRDPHVYLPCIGVRPERTGRGVGGALLRPGLEHADRLGLPAYLESSNPRNVSLYERHGFATTGEHPLPDGPTITLMRRPPHGTPTT